MKVTVASSSAALRAAELPKVAIGNYKLAEKEGFTILMQIRDCKEYFA